MSYTAVLPAAYWRDYGPSFPTPMHQGQRHFLREIHCNPPSDLSVHLIAENYATHRHETVKALLKGSPRFRLVLPTSVFWFDQVERFVGRITEDRICRGVVASVANFKAAIHDYLEHYYANPWTTSVTTIPGKGPRGQQALVSAH